MTADVLRIFIAIPVPDIIKKQIHEAQEILRGIGGAHFSMPRVDGIHLTVKFIGDLERSRISELCAAVKRASLKNKYFNVITSQIGGFPNLKSPRVVWWGVMLNQELDRFQNTLEAELDAAGWPRETRRFHPHLTIARIKSLNPYAPINQVLAGMRLNSVAWEVHKVLVMSSDLRPDGAVYRIVDECVLLHPVN